ncbi:MAG TPA: hypothetical protein VK857_03780 [Desulforhopalus sp.]|nr:hypothetical protein [Desulforhopalus sp.]
MPHPQFSLDQALHKVPRPQPPSLRRVIGGLLLIAALGVPSCQALVFSFSSADTPVFSRTIGGER